MSLGKSQGGSTQSDSFTSQQIAPFQADAYGRLVTNAENVFNDLRPGQRDTAQQLGSNLMGAQNNFTNSLSGVANASNPAAQNLLALGSQSNPFLQGQVDAFGRDIQNQLQQSLGQIGDNFVSAGQFGGSRQGVAEGIATRGAMDQFAGGVAGLRGGDLARQAQANQGLLGAQNQAAGIGQQGLPNAFNLGMSPFSSQLGFYGQLADVFGPPVTLTESQTRSRGRGGDSARLNLTGGP